MNTRQMPNVVLADVRAERAAEMASGELDVLVVGGGIVGAGIARDAAMRGLRVALVEQHDLAFGTSSRSSRLLHGGLRYLAQGRIGLVREASREKRILRRIAPHLCEPLAFVFPTYAGTGWPLWKLRIGVRLYDMLCGGENLGPAGSMDRAAVLEHVPGIEPRDLTGAVRYYDGLTNDSRLVLDTLGSAATHAAAIANYTRLEDADRCRAGWRCSVHDVLADRTYELTARSVVNATGPWLETLRHSRVRLRLTKGVHLVVLRDRLPIPDAIVATEGHRILFALPWGRRVILGSTDTDYGGPIEDVYTEPNDAEYVLGVINASFPSARLGLADVVSAWAGIRPLIANPRKAPSDISRRHVIRMSQPGWLDVAGGKLTTYRLIGEQAVDRLVGHLGRRAPPPRTANKRLLQPEATGTGSRILPPEVSAETVKDYCVDQWAVHLEDVMLRRAGWHYYRTDAQAVAQRVAGWMAEIFGWSRAEQEAEVARYAETAKPTWKSPEE